MAKRNYENKVENLTAAFIKNSKEKEKKEDVQEQIEPQKQEEPATEEKKESFPVKPEPVIEQTHDISARGSALNRYTFYITCEEKAALDQISIDEDMGKSEILREVLDAGLEAVSPGIFERTKEKADELRNRVKVTKNKNERKIYERLKKSLS